MEYRQLGGSDLKLSTITFGAWAAGGWMWGGNDRNDAIRAIRASYDLGVTSIDTAPAYGQGASEEIVGEAIKGIPRDQLQILTKYGMRWDVKRGDFAFHSKDNNGHAIDMHRYSGPESVKKECEASLRRLKTDYIDLYQIHWPDSTTPIHDTMEVVAGLIEAGKVRHAGVCNYNVQQLAEADKNVSIVSDQVSYSMVKRDIEEELIPWCVQKDKAILAYSPLERGLLTGKLKPGHAFAEGDHRAGLPYFSDENIKRTNVFLDELRTLAKERNATLSQVVLQWTLAQPGITIALVGARNEEQAIQNAKTDDVRLDAQEVSFISEKLSHLHLAFSTKS